MPSRRVSRSEFVHKKKYLGSLLLTYISYIDRAQQFQSINIHISTEALTRSSKLCDLFLVSFLVVISICSCCCCDSGMASGSSWSISWSISFSIWIKSGGSTPNFADRRATSSRVKSTHFSFFWSTRSSLSNIILSGTPKSRHQRIKLATLSLAMKEPRKAVRSLYVVLTRGKDVSRISGWLSIYSSPVDCIRLASWHKTTPVSSLDIKVSTVTSAPNKRVNQDARSSFIAARHMSWVSFLPSAPFMFWRRSAELNPDVFSAMFFYAQLAPWLNICKL